MKNLKSITLTFVLMLFAFGAAYAQDGEATSGSGDAMEGKARGEDPNITVEDRVNEDGQTSKAVQPSEKGAKARSSYCYVEFDNYTDWYISTYVDGYFEGTLSPWGTNYVTVLGGSTKLYAVARFDSGARITWGPVTKYCSSDDFDMDIYENYYNWSVR